MNPQLCSRLYDFRTGRDIRVPTFSTFTTFDPTTFDFTTFRLTTLEQAERRDGKAQTEGGGDETALAGRAQPDRLAH